MTTAFESLSDWEDVFDGPGERRLKQGDDFQLVFTSIVLVGMFALLLLDKYGPDHIMAGALALFLAASVVSIKDGLAGFSNEGVMTVMVLFVVAEGLTKTGALDWYMTKLLGKPKSLAVAQLRLMVPIASVSAFFNNTPIVVIMIPVVLKWCKHANIPVQQMMIPLSYATILGGTITTIGTSTNLVVTGLLKAKYPQEKNITLFDLAPYGLPFAIAGLASILALSPFLLPKGPYRKKAHDDDEYKSDDHEDVLLRARVTQWSPAAGRSVKRSGLREAGGLYLVSVQRAATGNIHRAVGQEFIINVNDVLFFTGLVERFGEFAEEHGLEVVTNEIEPALGKDGKKLSSSDDTHHESDPAEKLRIINRLSDIIQDNSLYKQQDETNPQEVVVTSDQNVVLVGIDAEDHPGLLKDITKVLFSLQLELHHTEAAVIRDRSISVWRTENISGSPADHEKISSVLQALLDEGLTGGQASKREGLSVIRAKVTSWSTLVGRTVGEVDFRADYKAAVIAVQQDGKNVTQPLSTVSLQAGDIVVLQASDDSPLLTPPTDGFYKRLELAAAGKATNDDLDLDVEAGEQNTNAWKDLRVTFSHFSDDGVILPREFLTAMVVAPNTRFANKSVIQIGLDKLPAVTLVSIERPAAYTPVTRGWYSFLLPAKEDDVSQSTNGQYNAIGFEEPLREGDVLWYSGTGTALGELRRIPGLLPVTNNQVVKLNEKLHDRRLVEAVVARNGPLVGQTVKEAQFRTRYGAAVIGVHRDGKRIHDYPNNIKLRAGDVLLLEAGPHFFSRRSNDKSFALFVEVEDSAPPRLHLTLPTLAILITMIAVYVAKDISLLICASIASALLIIIGVLSEQEARRSLNWEIYITVGAAFGIGTAMANSGVAGYLAKFLVNIGKSLGVGDAGAIGAVYLATTLISELVTNNAAAALTFPIAMNAAKQAGVSRRIMAFAVMLGSSDFATPYGYQTNLLVYGPGRYKFIDYIKLGIPLQIILFFTASICLSLSEDIWWATTLIALAALVVVAVVRIGYDTGSHFFGGDKKGKGVEKTTE